jgi:hypothetical protein
MRSGHTVYTRLVVVALVLAVVAGCSMKKYVVAEKPTGLVLEYRMPEGEVLKYKSSQRSDRTMEVMGLAMESSIYKTYEFSCVSQGKDRDNFLLKITIDAMDAGMETPQGDYSAGVDSVLGRSFTMVMSNLGRELDVSDAESIKYDAGPIGQISVKSDFEAVFPDLPGSPVEIGDTWTTQDSLRVNESEMDMLITMTRVHTLHSVEPMMGMEAAVVMSSVTGTISGAGKQGEAEVAVEGTLSGTETWYFAYERGLFVEWSSDVFAKNMIDVKGPQEMTFPMSEKMSFETTLIQ